jgi:ribosome-associated toxin RatA of RatAB toxin-antitoxin module
MATRLFTVSAVILLAALTAGAAPTEQPVMSVGERDGVYTVAARFVVPQLPELVREVLTDYPSIPRFMPGVRTSEVLARDGSHVRVEQEAVSKFMMFSKRVHLILDVEEGAHVIRFRDTCNRSFVQYEGSWTIARQGGETAVAYELIARRPAFSVPALILRKLLDRDASLMIERLREEIHSRAASR